MAMLEAEIPPRLREEAERFIDAGWHRDIDSLVTDALRRYLNALRGFDKVLSTQTVWQ